MDGVRKTGQLGLHCQGKTRECACYDGPPLSEPAISCRQDTGSSCPHCRAWMRQGLSPKRHGRSVCLWPRFEGALLPMGDLSGFHQGLPHPFSRCWRAYNSAGCCVLSRFQRRALYPELRIRGSVFLGGMPKALTVKKFSHHLSSLSPKGKPPCRRKKRRPPSAEPPRACTVLVCGFSISRRHRPASRRPRQAACQRG